MLTNPRKRAPARLLPIVAATLILAAIGMTASPASAAMPRADTAENTLLEQSWPSASTEAPKVLAGFSVPVGADTTLPLRGVKHSEIFDSKLAESCVSEDGTVHVTGRTWGSTTITVWTDQGVATYPLSFD